MVVLVPMVRTPLVLLVVVFLLLVSLVGPATSQIDPEPVSSGSCANSTTGSILVPTLTANPPSPLTAVNVALNDIYIHVAWIQPIGQNRVFYLWPTGGASHFGTPLPDFNIAFYPSGSGILQPIKIYNDVGKISGTVPGNAGQAMIWMRTGPDSPINWDGNPFGAEFNYRDACTHTPPGF